ncbi:hypothetical protein [Stenotrophomonas sp. CFBP8994]|uniref:hypothetical protein n=1 Tax=Stenotrophomonas sp. CFBP8994 TaxID=3096527 RepID=UPI002A6B51A1|nr:hypothetical protein [Stenotrophomonas sp. CFBP8994]MDY0978960.1 hypothetical protein [Stenotrophomonas sp. CFBP8994]
MQQSSRPCPADIPLCCYGNRPQIVTTMGAPTGHRLGHPCPALIHIECHMCQKATVPSPSLAITELRWTDPTLDQLLIPISHLTRARAEVLAGLPKQAA